MHCSLMTFQRVFPSKFATTDIAAKFLRSVRLFVFDQIGRIGASKFADVTMVWFLARVSAAVDCYSRWSE